ncbi:MAG: hypothetical protein II852_06415 [Bacteroidales bacterium]|jgi:hypothetical protein|nr:hypothetical protein [Bacteroidales bacterium]
MANRMEMTAHNMEQAFDDFVISMNRTSKNTDADGINVPQRIEMFDRNIRSLYQLIDNDWLKKGLESGFIKTGEERISINERLLGIYDVNAKWIQIGAKRLTLEPIGTVLVGIDARIDLIYKYKEIMLVLLAGEGKKKKPEWKYVVANGKVAYEPLTKDSFQKLIMDVVYETDRI